MMGWRTLSTCLAVIPLTVLAGEGALLGGQGEGVGYLYRIETSEQLERLSLPGTTPGVDRITKFTLPASDDPGLLPTVFQNVNLYLYHFQFLGGEFPERFPGLVNAGAEYQALVERRATRKYFAGTLYAFKPNPPDAPPTYAFDIYTLATDLTELPRLEEARRVHRLLTAAFTLGPVAYAPRTEAAVRNAEAWVDPGFAIINAFAGGSTQYLAYTLAENYGRVRVLSREEFAEANETGAFSWQDILVLEEAPFDIEGVIAGVITGSIQSELSHLAIRTGLRGTPNAYQKDAVRRFQPYQGKMVRLLVRADDYQVTEATQEAAQEWWDSHRPNLGPHIPDADTVYRRLDAAWEVDLDGPVRLVTRYGGKGSNFARLYALVPEANRVPGFCIPFAYYKEYLESNETFSYVDSRRVVTFAEYIEELLADPEFRGDSRKRFQELERLREMVEHQGDVSPQLVLTLIQRIRDVFGTTDKRVRFRSSSNSEDLLEFNGAGLYTSNSACAADDTDTGTGGPSLCLPFDADERGIARAMRIVWASLWNFRAYEEREYYQIPHDRARMAILVSEAFPDELANGVAFTGNPAIKGDRRFLINAQMGDVEVVFTEPGVEAEKDVLEMEGGQVKAISRVRRSSLAPENEFVLSDANLRELGAVMALVEERYNERFLELGQHKSDEVLLDFEWKLDRHTGHIRLKQVRPFLIVGSAPPPPQYKLTIPEGVVLCANFGESRPSTDVLRLKAQMALRAGEYTIRADGTSTGDVVEWLQFSPTGPRLAPSGPAVWQPKRAEIPGEGSAWRFDLMQDLENGAGRLQAGLVGLTFIDGAPSSEVVLDRDALTWSLNPYLVHAQFTFPDEPDPALQDTWLLPCDLSHLPVFNWDVEFSTGDRMYFEERFQDVLDGTGPAEVAAARIKLAGVEQEVKDYWRLAYTAGHHNALPYPTLWAVLDPAIDVPGVGRVKVVEVIQDTPTWLEALLGGPGPGGTHGRANLRGEDYQVLKPMDLVLFLRQRAGTPEFPQFRRGDANSSGSVTLGDAITILLYSFAGGDLACPDAADFDDLGTVDMDDALFLLYYLFLGLDPPAAPGAQRCGTDEPPDGPSFDDLPACDGTACR